MKSLMQMLVLAVLLFAGLAPAAAQQGGQQRGAGAAPDRGYVLGPNDIISVTVFGQPEFNFQTRIKPDGSITVPLLGAVQASGENVLTLAQKVGRSLEQGGFLKRPIVNVEVVDFGSRFVRVAGRVGAPGLYPLDRSYRVLDVLLRAGWRRDNGSNFVFLRRAADNREIRLDVEALARGGAQEDPIVEAGDTLFVPDIDVVYVYGQVNRPGVYPLLPGLTLQQVIVTAGGVTPAGSERRVRLTRAGKEEREVDGDMPLQRNDVVFIRERVF